jgi:hypothetical protein
MTLPGYILLAFSSLFVIVDPLAAVPAFIAMTPQDGPEQRIRMARLACCVMAGVLTTFALAGQLIFKLLGITMPAFEFAASVVLLLVALDMLRARRSRVQETTEETAAGVEKAAGRANAGGPGRDFDGDPAGKSGGGNRAENRVVRVHRRGFRGQLFDFALVRAGRKVVEPHRDKHRHPHHGTVARGGCDAIRVERRQIAAGGVDGAAGFLAPGDSRVRS